MSVLDTTNKEVAYAEYSGQKLPIWLRLLVIVAFSAALWSAIIWATVTLFFIG